MSYNESKNPMSNYPMMSQSQWDNAPFNEPHNAERDFEVNVTYTLAKDNIGVKTNDYELAYDKWDEDTYITDNTDWESVFKANHYSIPQLLNILRGFVLEDLNKNEASDKRKRWLQRVLEDCDGWELVESEYEES